MIDVYAAAGNFGDRHQLARDLARTLMTIEQVPDIPMFRQNTAAFVHELPADSLSNVDGTVPTSGCRYSPTPAPSTGTSSSQSSASSPSSSPRRLPDPSLTGRTGVLLTEAPDGGWGLAGHANTNAELVTAARTQIAELSASGPAGAQSPPRPDGTGGNCHG
jgi:hypothetical protein